MYTDLQRTRRFERTQTMITITGNTRKKNNRFRFL